MLKVGDKVVIRKFGLPKNVQKKCRQYHWKGVISSLHLEIGHPFFVVSRKDRNVISVFHPSELLKEV